jgi:hypothetical protein
MAMREDVAVSTFDRLGVELVHWPRDEPRRRSLARAGVARLLLVEPDVDAPEPVGVDEDWVRLPADERELWTRAERLSRLSSTLDRERPVLRDGRVLLRGSAAVVLSRSEAVALELLLDSVGSVVPRSELVDALWPGGAPPNSRALDGVIDRLRRRLQGMHLCIRAARGKGFVIYLDAE